MRIEFSVHRSGRIDYEADVPDDFDVTDEQALLELAETTAAVEVDSETHHLSAVGEVVA